MEQFEEGARRRPWKAVLAGVVVLALAGGGGYWYLNRDDSASLPEGCKVTTAAGQGNLDLAQAQNAATITAVTLSRGLPERAAAIALATSMQESKLRNLDGGDRDSVGLFQQRPSQGWGTAQQIKDPVYATNKFLDGLVKVPGYARLPLTDAAQAVQKSGYPQAYAKHEGNATLLASVFAGREGSALNCVVHAFWTDPVAAPGDQAAAAPAAAAPDVSARVQREFGRSVTVAPAAKAAADPRTVLAVTPQPATGTDGGPDARRQGGWAAAQWAVAHAPDLGIGAVAYDGKVWRFDRPADGWKPQPSSSDQQVLVTLGAPPAKR
ncbi:hypothetical protein ABT095_02530 [Kitasatospora sp. NPDC002227]|uniref:hypothetical protein n=1 Tax=Kitasatospora sp. NPDC002227 TaxID=3154773 RepID=UPI00332B2957